jgi:hypothetical protein
MPSRLRHLTTSATQCHAPIHNSFIIRKLVRTCLRHSLFVVIDLGLINISEHFLKVEGSQEFNGNLIKDEIPQITM